MRKGTAALATRKSRRRIIGVLISLGEVVNRWIDEFGFARATARALKARQ
jgi:hypothetical protein